MELILSRLESMQPPDFGNYDLWFWHNGQGNWNDELGGFPEGAD